LSTASFSIGISSVATHSYRARWIIPVGEPPIRDGVLTVHDGRIVELRKAVADRSCTDFHDAAIIPTLVNAHTHLEFSDLANPLGDPERPFTQWIQRVVSWRRERDEGWDKIQGASPRQLAAIQRGIEESLRSGTAVLGEIATAAESISAMEGSLASGVAFWEIIGWSVDSIRSLMEKAFALVANPLAETRRIVRGISPHAPYTVHQDLLRIIVRASAAGHFPVAMHLAESDAELQLLASGTGPFAEMMGQLAGWNASAVLASSKLVDYLRILAAADRALVIHGNYFDQREFEFLAAHQANMSVVYCPRTHHYFGHRDYPLEQMLDAGVRVALGTDSRASNPDLNLWNEVRFAARRHPGIAPQTWLKMATLNGAEALGMDCEYGSLKVGKVASFLVIPLSADQRDDPWSWIDQGWEPLIFTNRHE
jgi:cytosine/adenosine deaminase-related metal-dependent hydrolase